MEREPVESSAVRSMGYRAARRLLEVEYANGSIYRYHAVPPHVALAFRAAESKGEYVNRRIKPFYRCSRIRNAGRRTAAGYYTEGTRH